jgi:hypothetical protein
VLERALLLINTPYTYFTILCDELAAASMSFAATVSMHGSTPEAVRSSMLFQLRRNTVGISGAKFDVVEEGCKPTGITRSSEFAEKSCPAQTYLGRCPGKLSHSGKQ